MAATDTNFTSSLPNPSILFTDVDPILAHQLEVSRYLFVATCGMFSWDIFSNLRDDYRLITQYKFQWPTLVYFISRISTLAFTVAGVVFGVDSVPNCNVALKATGWAFSVATSSTSLLLFFRVRAIFHAQRLVILFFSIAWLTTLGVSIMAPLSSSSGHVSDTMSCVVTSVKPWGSASVIASAANDTLTFIFITYALLSSSAIEDTLKGRLKLFVTKKHLPSLTRALLQSGQEYYMITVWGNILAVALMLGPSSIPAVYRGMVPAPNIAVTNSMACRVFRYIKFERISPNMTTIQTLPTLELPSMFNSEDTRQGEQLCSTPSR